MKKIIGLLIISILISCDHAPEKDKYLNPNDPLALVKIPFVSSTPGLGRDNIVLVDFNQKLWAIGGAQPNYTPSALKEVWSTTDGSSWTRETNNAGWARRYGHTCVAAGSKMWLMGGTSWEFSTDKTHDVWSSGDGINWDKKSDAPWSVRNYHTAVFFNNKIWVMGGSPTTSYSVSNEVWSFDTAAEAWTPAATPPWSARYGHTCVVFNNAMWVIGGFNQTSTTSTYLNDVWSTTDGTNWTPVTGSASWAGRKHLTSAVTQGGKLLIMGGADATTYYSDVWSTTNGSTWTREMPNAQWTQRWGHSTITYNNLIWVVGGHSQTSYFSDVWSSTDGTNWTKK